MLRETCKNFASCRQHQHYTNGFIRSVNGSVLEKMWCTKCGRRWWEVYIHYMTIDSETGEVISKSDTNDLGRDAKRIIESVTDTTSEDYIPY